MFKFNWLKISRSPKQETGVEKIDKDLEALLQNPSLSFEAKIGIRAFNENLHFQQLREIAYFGKGVTTPNLKKESEAFIEDEGLIGPNTRKMLVDRTIATFQNPSITIGVKMAEAVYNQVLMERNQSKKK